MKNILVLFGGQSAEHEVSIITGIQVLEQIDRKIYSPQAIYVTKKGILKYLPNLKSKKDFKPEKGLPIILGRDEKGPFYKVDALFGKKTRIDAAYLAFHGGGGEGGALQGFMESLGIPYTSPNTESSVISMNKVLAKEVFDKQGIDNVPWVRFFSIDIAENVNSCVDTATKKLSLPIIIKPAHLGSSIGISIARTKIELKKCLLAASQFDSEVLVEKLISGYKEYNCAVRLVDGKVKTSEIEKPTSQDEILSFADKYIRGGSKKQSGMASLARDLPAKISKKLKSEIEELSKKAFIACRCKGMVRIDFMVTKSGKIYLTEINAIPGSMAFYLWEASGVSFTKQITDLIEQSINDFASQQSFTLDYESDIVNKFISS